MKIPEADYKVLFEAAPALHLILNQDLLIVGASDGYLEATFTKREEIVGKYLFDVFPDNPDDPHADGVKNLKSSLHIVQQTKALHTMAVQRYDIRKPDGNFETRYWSPVNKPVLDQKGEIRYIIHRVEDVTPYIDFKARHENDSLIANNLKLRLVEMEMEVFKRGQEIQSINEKLQQEIVERKECELELEKNVQQLESINKELEAFSYSVSHDLRAPLRAVDGYAKILHEDYNTNIDEEGQRLISVIVSSAAKMSKLIDNLLEFSRTGRKPLTLGRVNMNQLVESVIWEIEKSNPHQAEVNVEDLPEVNADQALIYQVMLNLVSNAIKYSSKADQPIITLTGKKEKGNIVYCVKDNGVGFDMKYAHKLFGVFQRLHTPEEFEGTGVGLAIVQRVVARHQGRVWVEAEKDKGAKFYISLPA